jgi:hypothetical protein
MFLSVLTALVTFVAAVISLLASGGQLWHDDANLPVLRRVTPSGWATACFGVICVISLCNVVLGEREKAALEAKLDAANDQVTQLRTTAETQLKVAERQADVLSSMEEITKYQARTVAQTLPRHGSIKRSLYSGMWQQGGHGDWYTAPEAPHPFVSPYDKIEAAFRQNLPAAAKAAGCETDDVEYLTFQLAGVAHTTGKLGKAYILTLSGTGIPLLAKNHETVNWRFERAGRRDRNARTALLRFGHYPEGGYDTVFRGQTVNLLDQPTGNGTLVQNHIGAEANIIWIVTDLDPEDFNCWVTVHPRPNPANGIAGG